MKKEHEIKHMKKKIDHLLKSCSNKEKYNNINVAKNVLKWVLE